MGSDGTAEGEQGEGCNPQYAHEGVGCRFANTTACNWSHTLHRVLAVGSGIVDVVETVNAACGQTKGNESHCAGPYIAPVGSMAIKEQGHKDKDVL